MWKLLCHYFRKRTKPQQGQNVVDGIVKAKVLYKKLIPLVHPDKNPNNLELADHFSKLLNQNRFNYNGLVKIEKMINEQLINSKID